MKKLLLALAFLIVLATPAFAVVCTLGTPLTPGSITSLACNVEGVVTNAPAYTMTDAAALQLGHWFALSNAGTQLVNPNTHAVTPVSGQITFSSGNSSLAWANHGLSVGSYLTLTGTLPSNFTASTTAAPVVYYVVGVPDGNHLTLSASPGGSAITPNALATGIGYNLVAGYSAWSNSNMNSAILAAQQAGATLVIPPQITITPQQ